ncbi:PAS domain-containing protein [Ideonella sp. 4Y16]|uniref:CheR family methyltransferase n=1 Tax=Ideonella alba TaxID=2824118 RepID=UPI001B388A97|nr:chemotaxis protein CheB [Ideonella alba]MBQ0942875.1 PAS domain-containing protein [Ideonella alba]
MKRTKATASSRAGPEPSGAAAGFPIVGIGASAGGLAAFEAFFAAIPSDSLPGMAFVLVQHLSPDHPSVLPDILRRCTHLPVAEATDGLVVAVNTVYVIPPGRGLEIRHGTLHLLEPIAARGHRLSIDGFFRSLALDREDASVGIVLSGTGSDGAQGVLAIKGAGGLVLAQSPQSTEFDGMPRAALGTGAVDQTLAPGAMPAFLQAFAAKAYRPAPPTGERSPEAASGAMHRVFAQLRLKTGHDFSHYKPTTVQRRVQRRMAVHQIETLEAYAAYLQQSADEVQALFRDLLIGVTQFFRDPEAFRVLEDTVVPTLLARRLPHRPLRAWVAGCSSGEEAYSIAMLMLERLDEPATPQVLQVFATDIDSRAIALARAGTYPASISADITPERLARHFTAEAGDGGWRVRKQLRDLLVFSEHDLTRDPPFSKLDLISCRNLLIYLDGTLQKRLIPLFHYALRPGGILLLGTSESIGEFNHLFEAVDRRAKVYRRLEDYLDKPRAALSQMLLPAAPTETPEHPPMPLPKTTLRERAERAILRELPIAAALVNVQGDIFYLHGRTGQYLEPAPGEAGISNILAMARDGLRRDLSLALTQAAAARRTAVVRGVRVKTNGHHTSVNLAVSALDADTDPAGPQLYLVLLEAAQPQDAETPAAAGTAPDAEAGIDTRLAALAESLRISEEKVQALHEELESSIEELKSSNEEMQSVNEELQSTNEELETSKEELQSVNEELSTVNAELENKVADLSRANDDMNNLLAGTGIATVFVDHGLRILRFTPGASEIINLIAGDIGRPVGHLASNLDGYDQLVADTQSVLDSLIPKTLEVRTRDGRWYAMRIQPYRTIANVIEGAVITFVDISESVRTRQALRKVNEVLRLAVVVRDAFDAVTVHDLDGRTLAWNPAAATLYGWSEAEALALNVRDRIPPERRAEALEELRRAAESDLTLARPTQRLTKDGRTLEVLVKATALQGDDGRVYATATTERIRPAAPT